MRYIMTLFFVACHPLFGQTLEWPHDLNGIPAANATNLATIESLVRSVLGPDGNELMTLGEFRFVPLETVTRIDLITTAGFSGRGAINCFIAVWRAPDGSYRHAILPADGSQALSMDAVDLDGHGVYELIAGKSPGPYLGAAGIGISWHAVYRLKQGQWENVSDRYPQARSERIPSLIWDLSDACSSGDNGREERYKDYALFVRFKQDHMFAHQSDSGLRSALEWANSADPVIQWLAVETLADIPGARAVSALRKLAGNSDAGVADFAKRVLAEGGAGKY